MSSQGDSREAIYDAVTQMAKDAVEYGGPSGAAMLRDAAYAWRAAAGGTQPGSVILKGD